MLFVDNEINMKCKFAILICCIFSLLGKMNAQTYAEKYNLDFKIRDNYFGGWFQDVNNSKLRLSYDSNYFRFSQNELWGFREKMRLETHSYQSILLPDKSNKTANINIIYKYKNLKDAKLLIYLLDKCEKITHLDSLVMIPTDTMFQVSKKLILNNTRFLSFRLMAYGKDSTYTNTVSRVVQTIPQELCIKELQIIIDDKLLNTVPFVDIIPLNINSDSCVRLGFDSLCLYDKIPLFSSKKIIALGENTHGSPKIVKSVYEVIKYQIMNNRCRLVLFESPLLRMLFFNRYVQGDDAISTEKLEELKNGDTGEVEPMIELVKWIRKYNQTAKEKIKLLGMDIRPEFNEFPRYANDYFETINKKVHSDILDSMIRVWNNSVIFEPRDRAKLIIDILAKERDSLMLILGKEDLKILDFYLKRMLEFDFELKNSYFFRDHNMFKVASYLIDSMPSNDSSVVIYAHWGHLNYTFNTMPIYRSTGSYMKERYEENYSCIGLSVYQDNIRVYNRKNKLTYNKLQLPPLNSLEYILNNVGYEYAYMNTSSLKGYCRFRIIGAFYEKQQFETIISPGIQMDGILFIK